jgi:hypothetical protein
MSYEPRTIAVGSDCEAYELAPGVIGYAVEHEGCVYIPIITARKQGAGDVGRFLDSLSARCRVPNVTSPRLLGMLQRRGWKAATEVTDDGHPCEVWARA